VDERRHNWLVVHRVPGLVGATVFDAITDYMRALP
jgi:hypothetical protein